MVDAEVSRPIRLQQTTFGRLASCALGENFRTKQNGIAPALVISGGSNCAVPVPMAGSFSWAVCGMGGSILSIEQLLVSGVGESGYDRQPAVGVHNGGLLFTCC